MVPPAYADNIEIPRGGWAPGPVEGVKAAMLTYNLIYSCRSTSISASSSNTCIRDADSPLPNARLVSLDFHPDVPVEDDKVRENDYIWKH